MSPSNISLYLDFGELRSLILENYSIIIKIIYYLSKLLKIMKILQKTIYFFNKMEQLDNFESCFPDWICKII